MLDKQDLLATSWENKDELIDNVLLETSLQEHTSLSWPTRTYIY